jgi:hypothetical protein
MESSQKIKKNRASDAEKTMATQEGNDSFYHNPRRNWKKKKIFCYLKVVFIRRHLNP